MKNNKDVNLKWNKQLTDLVHFKSNADKKTVKMTQKRKKRLLNSGELEIKSCNLLNSRKKKKKNSASWSLLNFWKSKVMLREIRLKNSSNTIIWQVFKLKHYLISKRRTSTLMLNGALKNGNLQARMLSLLSWSSKTIVNAFSDLSIYIFHINLWQIL
jgi:hypothetical protein